MFEIIVKSAAIRRGHEIRAEEYEHLANLITSKVVKAWNDGQKKG
jgi:hypothetical protein